MSAHTARRRTPRQARSRERVEAILDEAQRLLVDHNPDDLAMRQIARNADVPVSSIYQYFPTKAAILRALVERNQQRVSASLIAELERLERDYPNLPPNDVMVGRLIDTFYAHYAGNPQAIAVWAGAQADDALRALDAADNARLAALIAPLIARQMDPDSEGNASQAEVAALMIAEITGPVARLALQLGSRRSQAVVAQLKVMIISYLDRMAAEPRQRC